MSQLQPIIAFIGAGNMSGAIIGGLISKGYPAEKIWATARSPERRKALADKWGVQTTDDNVAAVAAADVVVLGVKPQVMRDLALSLAAAVQARKPLVISVAAGIEAAALSRWLGGAVALVRCMPNTPSLVQTGAAGLFANAVVSAEQRAEAEQILSAVGVALWVEREQDIDAVIAVSGSGPAYFFLFMEAMIEAGQQQGLSADVSRQLALQTALGAARMAAESDVDVAELRRRVTSPSGTTEQAIRTFEEGDLRGLVNRSMRNCAARAAEMAKELCSD